MDAQQRGSPLRKAAKRFLDGSGATARARAASELWHSSAEASLEEPPLSPLVPVAANQPPLESLCSFTVLPPSAPRWWPLLLLAYSPIGLALVLARIPALILTAALLVLLPPPLVDRGATVALRLLCLVWGIRVREGGDAHRARLRSARIIVANHLTQIDSLPFRLRHPISAVVRETYRQTALVRRLTCLAFQPIYVPTPGSRGAGEEERLGREAVRAEVQAHVRTSSKSLVYFPEGSITNGTALMRFSAFAFSLGLPVQARAARAICLSADEAFAAPTHAPARRAQPVALRVWSPLRLAYDTIWDPLHMNLVRMAGRGTRAKRLHSHAMCAPNPLNLRVGLPAVPRLPPHRAATAARARWRDAFRLRAARGRVHRG